MQVIERRSSSRATVHCFGNDWFMIDQHQKPPYPYANIRCGDGGKGGWMIVLSNDHLDSGKHPTQTTASCGNNNNNGHVFTFAPVIAF